MLKDDKTYPYIKATIWEDFPRLLFSRDMKKDGRSRYFGPYTSAGAVKDSLELIHKPATAVCQKIREKSGPV